MSRKSTADYKRLSPVVNARILREYSLDEADLPGEEWRPVMPNYEVSNLGRLRRATAQKGTRKGRIVKPYSDASGYARVSVYEGSRITSPRMHQLVAKAFLGERPSAAFEVNHLDRDKLNNTPANLEWVTRTGNISHSLGRDIHSLTTEEVAALRLFSKYFTQGELAERLGIGRSTVGEIIRGQRRHHG